MPQAWAGIITLTLIGIHPAGAVENHYRDRQMVQDMGDWSFFRLADTRNGPWVLAKVSSGPVGMLASGTIRTLIPLAGTPATTWTYSAEYQPFGMSLEYQRNSPYPVLEMNGDTIICQVHKALTGEARLEPIYLAPDEWEKYVAPALEFYKKNARLFQPEHSSENWSQLSRLLEDENPFLAVAACRLLAETWELEDRVLLNSTILKATGLRQALFTFIILKYSTKDERPYLADNLRQAVGAIDTSEKLKWIALGNFAVTLDPGYPQLETSPRQLTDTIQTKAEKLDHDTDTDRYIAWTVDVRGMSRCPRSVLSPTEEKEVEERWAKEHRGSRGTGK